MALIYPSPAWECVENLYRIKQLKTNLSEYYKGNNWLGYIAPYRYYYRHRTDISNTTISMLMALLLTTIFRICLK